MNRQSGRVAHVAGFVEATALFLFFYQALRVLFSVLFGLIYDALFAEIVPMTTIGLILIVVILALLTPLIAPKQPNKRQIALLASAVLVFLARIPLTLNDPQVRLVASILIVAGTGVYLASRLRDGPRDVVRALILALVVDQLLRAAGHTWDVTLREVWLWGQAAVSLGLCVLAGMLFQRCPTEESKTTIHLSLLGGLAWGSWLFLQTSLLAFPNAIARWSNAPYTATVPALLASTLLVALIVLPKLVRGISLRYGWFLGGFLLLILLFNLAEGYSQDGYWSLLSLLLANIIVLGLLPACFSHPSINGKKRTGLALALAGILFLVLSFAYAFAFTYAYTFDLFRDAGLPIFLVAGFFFGLPVLHRSTGENGSGKPNSCQGIMLAVGIALTITLISLVTILAWPNKPSKPATDASFRAATYNIHYGYDTDWHLSLEEQAQTIEASGADVVMLQEVDTGRPTSYMIDDAYWLAQRLDMDVVYLPTVEHLTGIALLSRYPILDLETLLLPSELEQTGIIWAELDVSGTPVNAFAIWLGLELEERARQLDAALPFIESHPGPAVFGGDFNSEPGSPVYNRIEAAGFVDPFPALGLGSPPTSPAINPTERIDFVWLRDLTPVDAQVPDSTASDHRMVVVEAALP
jgi:endonuclease/exonuclease/phosphatase family metal-dependent hydrolase